VFKSLGQLIVHRSKLVLILFTLTILVAGGVGSLSFGKLGAGGYSDLSSDSAKAAIYLNEKFGVEEPVVVLVVDSGVQSIDSPEVVQAAQALEAKVAEVAGITKTLSFWSTGGAPAMRSIDGKASFLFAYADTRSNDFDSIGSIGEKIQSKFDGQQGILRVYAAGAGVITHAINHRIEKDLLLAEAIAIPLTFLLLTFVFGSLVASAMPLVVGVSAILGAFFAIYLITLFTSVNVFALNLITGLGLGLGIDYALLMVNRYREELHAGKSVEDAIVNTINTAGKTVFYSGLTVLVTLSSLLFFPLDFLKSFGYAGVSVVSLAVLGALIPLPAILTLLGGRIDKGVVRKSGLAPKENGRWAQLARNVMHRPVPVVVGSLLLLGILAAPISNIAFAQVDSRVLPKSDPAAIAAEEISQRFNGFEGSPIEVVIPNGFGREGEVNTYLSKVSALDGISRIAPIETYGSDLRIQVIPNQSSRTLGAEKIINDMRDISGVPGTLIGGVAADFTDSQAGIARTLPWALGWIAFWVLILIFIFTGSIILPIKAVLLNALSLLATLGAVTWIFINGHLKWLVGDFTVTGTLDTGTIILVAVVVFGLSMDYELFLLSRIREEHIAGKSNVESVAIGLQRSARIITAAALLLAVVFAAFMTSGVTSIKMLGFGVSLAVLLDATIVRALLVPALMRLFGEFNWWAPKALRRFTITH
jgi:putative drug exporter of the RND superfamily